MPIQKCNLSGGKSGYRWGTHGHCYASREDALKQMRAIFHSGYTGAEADLDKLVETLAESKVQALKFSKENWNRKDAKAWTDEHGFKSDFLKINEDHLIFSQFPGKTNAEFSSIEIANGITLKLEGEVSSLHNTYMEAVRDYLESNTQMSTETERIDDTMKPTTSNPGEYKFLFDKRRFAKDQAEVWFKHYLSKKFGMVQEDKKITLVDEGDFWTYECLDKAGFSKFKTVDYGNGVTCILGIV